MLKFQALSQAERRALLLLAIVALGFIAITAMRSCRSQSSAGTPPDAATAMPADSTVDTHALLPDTIMPPDTAKHTRKRTKTRKPASSAYKERNILDETL